MPASYTPQQKAAIAQFVGFTSTKDSVAAKCGILTLSAWLAGSNSKVPESSAARPKAVSREGRRMSMSKEQQAEIVKRQCREQRRGDWATRKTWYDKALALGVFKFDRKDVRFILQEAEAKGEYLPLLNDEVPFGDLANEFERHLLPSYFQSKISEAEGLNGVLQETPEVEEEIFHSEDSFILTKKLFRSLIKQASNKNSWIEAKELPLYLRFAIKRPLMSELQFCRALEMLDLTLDFKRAGTVSAIDSDPAGVASDESEKASARQYGDTRQLLMNVYGIFQDGMIHLEEAHQHYREILGYTDVDRETLNATLQHYGIPFEQTPSSGQSAARDAATQSYPSTQAATLTRSLKQELPIDKGSMAVINELSDLIKLYRCRHVTLAQVPNLIYETLQPYKPKKGVIRDYVKGTSTPDYAARSLWEEAVEEDSDDSSEDDQDDEDDEDDSNENDAKDDENVDASGDVEDTGIRGQRQDTPISDDTATPRRGQSSSITVSPFRDPVLYVQTGSSMPSRRARRLAYKLGLPYDYLRHRVRERSMRVVKRPAKRAITSAPFSKSKRKPSDVVGQSSLRRSPRLELSTKPPDLPLKSKRKASDVVEQSSPRKSPRLRLFVKPRDPKEDPGQSFLERQDVTDFTIPCPICSHDPCRCAAEPEGPPDLDPRCRKCQQEPCTCVDSLRSPEFDQQANAEGSIPSAHIDFNDIGQYSGSPYPVLAFLSHIWEAQDIFQSFIRVGFGKTTEAMRKSAYRILAEIGLGIKLGEIRGRVTEKDVAAVAVLNCLQGGSHQSEEVPSFSTKKGSPKISGSTRAAKSTQSSRHPIHNKSSSSGSHQDPNLILSHLINITEDPFIIPRLMKVVTSVKISPTEVVWMKTLLDSVPKHMSDGAIKGRFSKEDLAVIPKMQLIVKQYSSITLQHAKENAPPGEIDLNPVPPKLTKYNPVLAYLTRVLKNQDSEDSTLEFIRSLERNPMSKGTMGEIERINGLVRQGMSTRKIGRGPQAWKDIAACDILDRLYKKCKPLHDWGRYNDMWNPAGSARKDGMGTGNLEEPKDSNSSSDAPAQDLRSNQHSSIAPEITGKMEGENLDTKVEIKSFLGPVKLMPSLNSSWSPTNEFFQSSGTPVISEARHSGLDGAEDPATPPLRPQPGSNGIPRPASTAAEPSRQSPDSPSLSRTTPHELSLPENAVAESGFESPERPPTSRRIAKELPSSINPVAESSLRGPEPPASPRPKSKKLPNFVNAATDVWLKSPEPPPTPQLKSKELPRPVVAVSKSPLQDSERDLKERPEQPPSSEMFKDMTAEESFEYFQDVAFREGRSFSSVMAERRAIRQRPGEADYRCFPSFFQSSNGGAPNLAATLSKLFDKYRDNPKEEPDKIGVEGSMKYLGDLHVKLDEVVVLAVLTELNAPTMGEFSRGPFIDGWVKNRADTLPRQQAQVATWRRSLSTSSDFFKKVYKQTFILARQQGQRVLPLDVAIEYWRLLFTPPSLSWNTSSTPWLDWWIEYLEEKWAKSINKDMWDQTHNFMVKSREDETMSWWSEDGAWPGVLDEFVVYVKQKRGMGTGTEMDVG